MDTLPLIFVLTGSVLHLGWNVLAKDAEDKLAFLWLALLVPSTLGLGFGVYEMSSEATGVTPWICLMASSLVHIFYFWSLANAYQYADLSFVYPYCRGIGALFATIMGLLLLNEKPSIIGGMGIGLTILATFIEPILSKDRKKKPTAGLGLTIATGLAIASYLVIDKIGVGHMSPYAYLGILFSFITIGFAPTMLKGQRFRKEFVRSRHRSFIASLFMTSGYGVVLAAMTLSPVSYVVAARATGIVLSGIAGVWFFSEAITRTRWMAIGLITVGIFLISIG